MGKQDSLRCQNSSLKNQIGRLSNKKLIDDYTWKSDTIGTMSGELQALTMRLTEARESVKQRQG